MTRTDLAHLSPLAQLRAPRLPRRLVQLAFGLVLYGWSMGMMYRASLGLDPWDVLHAGLAELTGLSFGTVVIAVGVLVLLAWIPLKQWPGLGTIANAVLIGLSVDVAIAVIPTPEPFVGRLGLLLGGVFLCGLASALYIGSQLGAGPRDGLMTGIVRVSGLSVRLVRTTIEVLVLVIGVLLGGPIGLGTVVFAIAIGPIIQVLLPWFTINLESAGSNAGGLESAEPTSHAGGERVDFHPGDDLHERARPAGRDDSCEPPLLAGEAEGR